MRGGNEMIRWTLPKGPEYPKGGGGRQKNNQAITVWKLQSKKTEGRKKDRGKKKKKSLRGGEKPTD